MNNEKLLTIFDISSHLNRAYRYRTGSNSKMDNEDFIDGIPVFAARSTLRSMYSEITAVTELRSLSFSHLVCVLDHEGKNFRHRLSSLYKAGRPEKEEEFLRQRAILELAFKHLGYTLLKVPDVESDDVIGTIVTKCNAIGFPVTVHTRDKDMYALLTESTTIYSGVDRKMIVADDVYSKLGVTVDKVQDFLCLTGDAVDGVDGIPRIGAKTAAAILGVYTADQIIEDPSLIENVKVRGAKGAAQSFSENIETFKLARELVQLKTDVMLESNMREWQRKDAPMSVQNALFNAVQDYKQIQK